jgi:hypothetical protein
MICMKSGSWPELMHSHYNTMLKEQNLDQAIFKKRSCNGNIPHTLAEFKLLEDVNLPNDFNDPTTHSGPSHVLKTLGAAGNKWWLSSMSE